MSVSILRLILKIQQANRIMPERLMLKLQKMQYRNIFPLVQRITICMPLFIFERIRIRHFCSFAVLLLLQKCL